MFRSYQQFFILVSYIYFLSFASTSSPNVTVTFEDAYITETTSKFAFYGVEDFDTVAQKWHKTYVSNFNSSGYESSIRGNYNKGIYKGIQGKYTGLEVQKNDDYGGVGPEGVGYAYVWYNCDLELTSTGPWGINYFGFHAESLNRGNRVEFLSGGEMIFQLKMEEVATLLTFTLQTYEVPSYLYNPNPKLKYRKKGQLFAFLNVYFEGATFDTIRLRTGWSGAFEMDTHTLGFYTEQSGFQLPIKAKYIPPRKKQPEQPKYEIPKFPHAFVDVKIELPSESDTSARFVWVVRENFNKIPVKKHLFNYVTDFKPDGVIKGTYSAPFEILHAELGRKRKFGSYFATTDSLLNLTVTGRKGPDFFGLYLNPLNRDSSLEFFLNGERIYVLYLVDVFDYIEFQPDYSRSAFLHVQFHPITYDAVRIRNWSHVGETASAVASANHVIGRFLDHPAKLSVAPRRTILKIKSFPKTDITA